MTACSATKRKKKKKKSFQQSPHWKAPPTHWKPRPTASHAKCKVLQHGTGGANPSVNSAEMRGVHLSRRGLIKNKEQALNFSPLSEIWARTRPQRRSLQHVRRGGSRLETAPVRSDAAAAAGAGEGEGLL